MSRKRSPLSDALIGGALACGIAGIFGGSSKTPLIEQMIPPLLDLIKYQKEEIKGRREDSEELQEKIEKLEAEIKDLKSRRKKK